jgi:aspartate oxidase
VSCCICADEFSYIDLVTWCATVRVIPFSSLVSLQLNTVTCAPSETDFLVVGAGVAGLRAAIELAPAGRVVVLAKREVADSNTQWAQGGIAAALSDEDEISLHLQDTLIAGDGLCNVEAAKVLVEEAPARIEELIQWGTEFDRQGTRLTFGREGAHSRNRILHAHGDSTGREILRALYAKAKALKNISICEFEFSTDLRLNHARVCGIHVIDEAAPDFRIDSAIGHRRDGAAISQHHQPGGRDRRRRRHGVSSRSRN